MNTVLASDKIDKKIKLENIQVKTNQFFIKVEKKQKNKS